MANYSNLKASIDAVIKQNGRREITGDVLNQVLKTMVNSLGGGYQMRGVATPTTNPGSPDQNVFYLAFEGGTYVNFNALAVEEGISVIKLDGSTWSAQLFFGVDGIPTEGSDNLMSSDGVAKAIKTDVRNDAEESGLDISDNGGNVVASFKGGNIQTKNFNSATDGRTSVIESSDDADLEFSDEKGNAIVRFKGGHIQTKNFDSEHINGGSSDYNSLTNKPSINGHTLTGNSTPQQLGLQVALQQGDGISISGNVIKTTLSYSIIKSIN